ncbi:hypothetical protein FRC02_005746 [Tulasnella sp. 418]|nr:hypothetical protein FRC02_005746 [Tulasnella sp. 418]
MNLENLSAVFLIKLLIRCKGPWSAVSKAIHDCHAAVHAQGAPRIATDIRIGTRIDRQIAHGEGNIGKVKRVEEILRRSGSTASKEA